MDLKFSLFPLERIARNWQGVFDGNFDDSLLPFEISKDVYVEDVSSLISDDEFEYCKQELGTETTKHLDQIKYAIIHRFPTVEADPDTGELILEQELAERSRQLVQEMVACLRLIRPAVQHVQFLGGSVEPNGTLRHFHFDNPINFLNPLPNQTIMAFRTQDLMDLRKYAPDFRKATEGSYWKFRMAVDMFQSGYFQQSHWKLRFFMWTAALEALFTSHTSPQHRGSLVVKERVKDLLGATTKIYQQGEISQYEPDPLSTVGDVIDEIYCLRNHIAHGDKVPDYYFITQGRQGINGPIYKGVSLSEAISSIVRQSLLAILNENLLPHFQDDVLSEAYFMGKGLTNAALQSRDIPRFDCPS